MMLLAKRLGREGIEAYLFGYVPALQNFDAIATRLARRMAMMATDPEYILVGHSLGGLLLRAALGHLDPALPRPRHLYMLATPNRSPRLARRFRRNLAYRVFAGDSGQLLAHPARVDAIPPPPTPFTIITGNTGWRGWRSPFGEEPNDWIVSLSEARLTDGDDLVTVAARHTFLMNDREVVKVILQRIGARARTTGAGG